MPPLTTKMGKTMTTTRTMEASTRTTRTMQGNIIVTTNTMEVTALVTIMEGRTVTTIILTVIIIIITVQKKVMWS